MPQKDDAPDLSTNVRSFLTEVQLTLSGVTVTRWRVMSSLHPAVKLKLCVTGSLHPSETLIRNVYEPAASTTTEAVEDLSLVIVQDFKGLCIDAPGAETTSHWNVSDEAGVSGPGVTTEGSVTRVTAEVLRLKKVPTVLGIATTGGWRHRARIVAVACDDVHPSATVSRTSYVPGLSGTKQV